VKDDRLQKMMSYA